jgi:hypothetical protein
MSFHYHKAKLRQISALLIVICFACYYNYQTIYLAAKPAAGILLAAHLWINGCSIVCANLFLRFGGTSQQKRKVLFEWYISLVLIGLLIYLVSIPAIFSNAIGCLLFVALVYITTELLTDLLLNPMNYLQEQNLEENCSTEFQ